MPLRKLLLCFISAALGFTCGPFTNPKGDPRPNIVLIVADDLGFTDLGCFGSEINTPNLDALAEEGIRNTAFYTAPTCSPTRGMLLTGVDNHRNGYGTMEGDWAENQKGVKGYEGHLNHDVVTFPKLLQDAGYHTSMAGKWHQAFPTSRQDLWPNQRGFTRSFCLLPGGAGHFSDMQPLFSFYNGKMYVEDGNYVDSLPDHFYSSDFYTDKVISYIEESQKLDQPFFTYLSFTAPHWPLQVPDEYLNVYHTRYDNGYEDLAKKRLAKMKELGIIPAHTQIPPLTPNVMPWNELTLKDQEISARIMEIYASMIERLDANVGKLVNYLKSKDQYENTLVIFMSDNGAEGNNVGAIADTENWVDENFNNSLENIGRKNSYVYTGPGWAQVSTLPFKWYKGFSTEGGVRCPLILRYNQTEFQAGFINSQFISVKDIAPTIIELAGITHPGNIYRGKKVFPIDGISILPWLKGQQNSPYANENAHCWELYGRRAVRKGKWKAEWYEPPHGQNKWELYDLENDPGELVDLAASYPEMLRDMISEWEKYAKRYKITLPNEKVGYGPDKVWID